MPASLGAISSAVESSELASGVELVDVEGDDDEIIATTDTDTAVNTLLKHAGSWWRKAGRRGVAWSFWVPTEKWVLEAVASGVPIRKDHGVDCWLCHMRKEGVLHDNFPLGPEEEADIRLLEAVEELRIDVTGTNDVDLFPKYHLLYKVKSASSNLKQHCKLHHGDLFRRLCGGECSTGAVSAKEPRRAQVELAFKSTKRLKLDDPRQTLFIRLLTYTMLFLRWSFSVVDNPWFRALVWFLDPTLTIPNRKKWSLEHLPGVVEETFRHLEDKLSGVRGVSLMFDLWMSRTGMSCQVPTLLPAPTVLLPDFGVCRAGEDVLSLDIAFIDRDWKFCTRNVGIVHCKEGTNGEQVAAAIKPALTKHKLMDKIYAYVKDSGSNLKTTATALSDGVEGSANVQCHALGFSKPFAGDCYAHAVNGACNKAVLAAKALRSPGLDVGASLKKLRECCTYIKKSSVGLRAYLKACAQVGKSPMKIPTPAKTRFTSVSTRLLHDCFYQL